MESEQSPELIEESIRLELNVASLYHIFFEANPEDAKFWWELHLEEKSHALLIRAAKDSFAKRGNFPSELITNSVKNLKNDNAKIEALIDQFKQTPPERAEAFEVAIEIENTASESHYQKFMDMQAGSTIESVFQQLNREDKDHAYRIRAYLNKHI